jgi:hypothetical protein
MNFRLKLTPNPSRPRLIPSIGRVLGSGTAVAAKATSRLRVSPLMATAPPARLDALIAIEFAVKPTVMFAKGFVLEGSIETPVIVEAPVKFST